MSVCVIYLFLLFESSWVSGITSSSLLHLFCNCHDTNSILDMYFQLSQYLENWIDTLSWCKSSFLHSSMTWCDRRVTSTGSSSFWTWFRHMLAIWPGLSSDSLCSRHLDIKVNTIGSTLKNPPTSLVSSATFSGLCWIKLRFKQNPRICYRKEKWFSYLSVSFAMSDTMWCTQAHCDLSEFLETGGRIPWWTHRASVLFVCL